MKFLKFIEWEKQKPLEFFQTDFAYIVSDSYEKIDQANIHDVKYIKIRITGGEDAKCRACHEDYNIDKAFFAIAKKYITQKISEGKTLNQVEELFTNSIRYLSIYDQENFNKKVIKICPCIPENETNRRFR